MNVQVMMPESLRAAVEGRFRVELGVPPTADVADVVQTLVLLYPKLTAHLPSERRPVRQHLNIFQSEQATEELAQRRGPLREGQVIYLAASCQGAPLPVPRPTRR